MLKENNLENLLIALKDDNRVIGDIYDLMYNEVYRYIYSIVHAKEYAQDLTHDTFIQIYKNAGRYESMDHNNL